MTPGQSPELTDPSYISEQMFDRVIREKFQFNQNDDAVRDQASKLVGILRTSQCRPQVIVDILHAAEVSGQSSAEGIAEIGFAMGLQFGFELALSFPPLGREVGGQDAKKYKAKVFLASLCVTFAIQVLFQANYEYDGDLNFVIRLIVAALLSVGFTFFWGQFKKA